MKFPSDHHRSFQPIPLILGAMCLCFSMQVPAQAKASPAASDATNVKTAAAGSSARPWMDKSLSPRKRADLLIKAMTLDEKIVMMHGATPMGIPRKEDDFIFPPQGYVGYVPANKRLGIPALTLADGRAGVGNQAKDVTLLPAPIAAASSWDLELMNRFGHVLGKEEWDKGTNVTLSPTIDVVRVPEWGRTFER
jgi:beta-glucosidase